MRYKQRHGGVEKERNNNYHHGLRRYYFALLLNRTSGCSLSGFSPER